MECATPLHHGQHVKTSADLVFRTLHRHWLCISTNSKLRNSFCTRCLSEYACQELLRQMFAVPRGHNKSKPFIDHIYHFALVDDPARPDLHRHPLARYAAAVDVDVEEGCALLLPAYWYHRVESSAPPDRLNVAVNVWFDADVGGGAPARLHRMLRERLVVDCT